MDLVERMRRMFAPVNEIAPAGAGTRDRSYKDVERGIADDPSKPRPYASEPATVSSTYYVEIKGNERHYFDDYKRSALAIRASERSVRSQREDLTTVRAMLDIAQSRQWGSLVVRGSSDFRREAWIEARVRGLPVKGYDPSDPDRQEADRRIAERQQAQARTAPGAPSKPDTAAAQGFVAGRTPWSADIPAAAPVAALPSRLVRNRLTESGANSLSADAQLLLAALTEKIDRQMQRRSADVRAELKAFAVAALVRKETDAGTIALTPRQKLAAGTGERQRSAAPAVPLPESARRGEPAPRHRSIGR